MWLLTSVLLTSVRLCGSATRDFNPVQVDGQTRIDIILTIMGLGELDMFKQISAKRVLRAESYLFDVVRALNLLHLSTMPGEDLPSMYRRIIVDLILPITCLKRDSYPSNLTGSNANEQSVSEFSMELFLVMNWTVNGEVCELDRKRMETLSISPPASVDETAIIPPDQIDQFWYPDLYFDEASSVVMPSAVNPTTDLEVTRLSDGCGYKTKIKLSTTMKCVMDFIWFPVDRQECSINVRSFIHGGSDLGFYWRDFEHDEAPKRSAFRVDPSLLSLQYTTDHEHFPYLRERWSDPIYPELKARGVSFVVKFRRNVFYQLMSTYIPLMGNVITAFAAFWMSSQEVASRVNITATTLLAIFFQMSTFRNQLPQLPIVTACDYFVMLCLLNVFASIIECVMVQRANHLIKRYEASDKRNQLHQLFNQKIFGRIGTDQADSNSRPAKRASRFGRIPDMLKRWRRARAPRGPGQVDGVMRHYLVAEFIFLVCVAYPLALLFLGR